MSNQFIVLGVAAAAGALVAILVCRWHAARALAMVLARLHMSELARHAVQERSDQARLQIGQLTRALADANRLARQAHALPLPAPEAAPVAAPPEPAPDLLLQRRGPPQAFADTQLL